MIKYDSIFFLPFFLINRIKTYLSSFVLNKFFLKKNRLYIINHILFISKKIVKYIESMKKIVLKNFFLYAQILILNINKIEKHYNYCRIFFFLENYIYQQIGSVYIIALNSFLIRKKL